MMGTLSDKLALSEAEGNARPTRPIYAHRDHPSSFFSH